MDKSKLKKELELEHISQSAIIRNISDKLKEEKEKLYAIEKKIENEREFLYSKKILKANNVLDEVILWGEINYTHEKKKELAFELEKILKNINAKYSWKLPKCHGFKFDDNTDDLSFLSYGSKSIAPLAYSSTVEEFIEKYKDLKSEDIFGLSKTISKEYREYLYYCCKYDKEPNDSNYKEELKEFYKLAAIDNEIDKKFKLKYF